VSNTPFKLLLCALIGTGCAVATDEELAGSEDQLTGASRDGHRCSEDHPTKGRCLTEAEVARHVRAAGFPESIVATMVCVAKYESSLYERAVNDKNRNGSTDRGIFQVNSINIGQNANRVVTNGCPSSSGPLFDPATNARCAFGIYKVFQRRSTNPREGIKAWYGYTGHPSLRNSDHRAECDAYRIQGDTGARAPQAALADENDRTDEESDTDDETSDDTLPLPPPAPPFPPVTRTDPSTVPGACWAGTLREYLPPGGCYQRISDAVWFQCNSSQWYRGITGDGASGPFGTCSPSRPLQ
jgi:hypothetical protein